MVSPFRFGDSFHNHPLQHSARAGALAARGAQAELFTLSVKFDESSTRSGQPKCYKEGLPGIGGWGEAE